MDVATAIRESILQDRIVTIDYSPARRDELRALAEDSAKTTWERGPLHEFWGRDEGAEWRVHLEERTAEEEEDRDG
jgi:hypothetical protein